MSKTILITGASGMIGRSLTRHLLQKGHRIHHLNRNSAHSDPRIKSFKWDVYNGKIDENCIDGVDTIVHLAGENIAGKAWTRKRKHEIVYSRTESIRLIYNLLKQKQNSVSAVISSSAVGYYGDRGDEVLTEVSKPSNDFLGQTCSAWEAAVDEGSGLGLRVVKLRTGVVLTLEGGALSQIAAPVKWGFGAPLGSGKQWVPWIHLDDVLGCYEFAIENESLSGAYNMAAPRPVTNKELTKEIAQQLGKPLWLPSVPSFALKLMLGEMAAVVLSSERTSSAKIQQAGFAFKYLTLREALKNIYAS